MATVVLMTTAQEVTVTAVPLANDPMTSMVTIEIIGAIETIMTGKQEGLYIKATLCDFFYFEMNNLNKERLYHKTIFQTMFLPYLKWVNFP